MGTVVYIDSGDINDGVIVGLFKIITVLKVIRYICLIENTRVIRWNRIFHFTTVIIVYYSNSNITPVLLSA